MLSVTFHRNEICKNITIIWLFSLFTKEMWSMPRLDFVPIAKVIKKKFAWCLNFENGSESNMYSNGRTWFEFTLSCGFILYLVKHQFFWTALQLNIDCIYFIQIFFANNCKFLFLDLFNYSLLVNHNICHSIWSHIPILTNKIIEQCLFFNIYIEKCVE